VIVTGTPLQNSVKEMFNLLSFLDPEKFDPEKRVRKEKKNERMQNKHKHKHNHK